MTDSDMIKQLIDELSKMPPMVIQTAYLHAINYTRYGVDVTNKWLTAIQQTSAIELTYAKGYHDAMEHLKSGRKENKPNERTST